MSMPNSPSTLGPNQKPCPQCGKAMHRQSGICRACHLASRARPQNYAERACEKCGKTFRVHISQTAHGYGRYCSRSCARSGSPTRKKASPFVECGTCGKRFNKFASETKKMAGSKHFCSLACWYSFNQRDNHYLWTGGQHDRMNPVGVRWRRAVMQRDKYYCRLCAARRKLEAHHILPFGTHPESRWDVGNGITLCHDCHVALRFRELEDARLLHFIASVPLMVIGKLSPIMSAGTLSRAPRSDRRATCSSPSASSLPCKTGDGSCAP